MFLYHDNNPPKAINNIITAIPLKAESLYRSKKGIRKNVIVVIEEMNNTIHKIPGGICKCHCKTIPAIKGSRNRINGAFFQT
jgi:hypothetical protein